MTPYPIQIAPSILSCDFSKLGQEITMLTQAGADRIHLDVMDGHFVPPLTFGPALVQALRSYTSLPFDVHLMVQNPQDFFEAFAQAGADVLTFHPEAGPHVHRNLQKIRSLGKKAGLALNPATSLTVLDYVWEDIDHLLVMSVNPGFGGQPFLPSQLVKISQIRSAIGNRAIDLAVDGGINAETAPLVQKAGANILVAGTAVFKTPYYRTNIDQLRSFKE